MFCGCPARGEQNRHLPTKPHGGFCAVGVDGYSFHKISIRLSGFQNRRFLCHSEPVTDVTGVRIRNTRRGGKNGLPHQPAGWFAMTEQELRCVTGDGAHGARPTGQCKNEGRAVEDASPYRSITRGASGRDDVGIVPYGCITRGAMHHIAPGHSTATTVTVSPSTVNFTFFPAKVRP